jgi:hypothetical protein
MIRVVPSDKIQKEKWDKCVQASPDGNIFGLYDSISTACEHWLGIIYKDYEAVLALPVKKKLGLTYSWHPQFMGPLGVFSGIENAALFLEIMQEASRQSWWIKMHYWQNETAKKFQTSPRVFQVLDLQGKTMDEVRSGYNENTKRNYKKAVNQKLSIQQLEDTDLVIKAFKENKGDQIADINEDSYHLLKKLMVHWMAEKNGSISAVFDGDQLAAIGYFLTWKKTVIYYKGAVTEYGRANGAMHFLIDQEIEKQLGTCDTFDFGGSNIDSVSRFYKGFGGKDRNYYFYEYKRFKI